MTTLSLVAAQNQFTAALTAVDAAVRFAFRGRLRPQDYEEAVAEARAAWSAWAGLLKRGKDPVEIGVHGIATNAVRHVRNGRRFGNPSSGWGAADVYHRSARARGVVLVSLDHRDGHDGEGRTGGMWRDWLAEDRRVTPAEEACFRVDFGAWLDGLPARTRRLVELLAERHNGIGAARGAGVSPGRLCQVRPELEASWRDFQGEEGCGRQAAATG